MALDKAAVAAMKQNAQDWLPVWRDELAAFRAEREQKEAEAREIKDENKKAAALLLARDHKDASIGRHTAIIGALEEIEIRAAQIETYLDHATD